MSSSDMTETDSDSEDISEDSLSLKETKSMRLDSEKPKTCDESKKLNKLSEQCKKFQELKAKSSEIRIRSSARRLKTELRRSQKLVKKALKDPWIKAAVDESKSDLQREKAKSDDTTKWEEVKPFLTVNDHLQGPVSHGDCGPKTELEYQIEDCINEGDFEKAELLSDTLADRQFAVKIAHAFAAKKYQEEKDTQKRLEKEKQKKKFRGTFDAKERWEMKGNM